MEESKKNESVHVCRTLDGAKSEKHLVITTEHKALAYERLVQTIGHRIIEVEKVIRQSEAILDFSEDVALREAVEANLMVWKKLYKELKYLFSAGKTFPYYAIDTSTEKEEDDRYLWLWATYLNMNKKPGVDNQILFDWIRGSFPPCKVPSWAWED